MKRGRGVMCDYAGRGGRRLGRSFGGNVGELSSCERYWYVPSTQKRKPPSHRTRPNTVQPEERHVIFLSWGHLILGAPYLSGCHLLPRRDRENGHSATSNPKTRRCCEDFGCIHPICRFSYVKRHSVPLERAEYDSEGACTICDVCMHAVLHGIFTRLFVMYRVLALVCNTVMYLSDAGTATWVWELSPIC